MFPHWFAVSLRHLPNKVTRMINVRCKQGAEVLLSLLGCTVNRQRSVVHLFSEGEAVYEAYKWDKAVTVTLSGGHAMDGL